MLAAARRARDLVKQILAFSHDIGGLALAAVDLREVVREPLRPPIPSIQPNCHLVVLKEAPCRVVHAKHALSITLW